MFVLPAYAGMFPHRAAHSRDLESSPRVCGDVSRTKAIRPKFLKFSPRMRGCFHQKLSRDNEDGVLPAYAGMFPHRAAHSRDLESSPRVCGDVSRTKAIRPKFLKFSPRMRGCFHQKLSRDNEDGVLPAYAGMFPSIRRNYAEMRSSPRVCGDVSRMWSRQGRFDLFSPRMRGCFR